MARLVFLGTPEAAVAPLRALEHAGHEVVLVVTRPDKRRGRRGEPTPSPVKAAALELGLPVTEVLEAVPEAGAELGVVVAYGRIIPEAVLDVVPMVNLHFSLLPRWRGAAPVERAILEGDAATGVCLMAVESGLDTGGIYAELETAIEEEETAEELRSRLVSLGTALLVETLADGVAGLPQPRDQMGSPSYAEKIRSAELRLEWAQPAVQLRRVVRIGRAWTTFRGSRLGVVQAGGGDGGDPLAPPGTLIGPDVIAGDGGRVRLVTVQPEGRRPMAAEDWLRGARPTADEQLGT
jgi:methionyl-tRNA formyltransferase